MLKRLLLAMVVATAALGDNSLHYGFLPSAAVTVTTSATRLDTDARHAFVEACNTSASTTLYVSFSSTVTATTGRPVSPGQCIQFVPLVPAASRTSTTGQLLYGIVSAGTASVVVTEGFEQ